MTQEEKIQHKLGKLEERTGLLPQMAQDATELKTKMNALPCENHVKQIVALAETTANLAPKLKLLWALLVAAGIAIIGVVVSSAMNGGVNP